MFNTEQLEKKWDEVLNHPDVAPIKDSYKRSVVARLLENQQVALREERSALAGFITEDGMTTGDANVSSVGSAYDPVLISLVRRAMPNIIAYDIAGVQPMTMPTGLIFAMRAEYKSTKGAVTKDTEALHFGEGDPRQDIGPDTAFSGDTDGGAMSTAAAEALSGSYVDPTNTTGFAEMGFTIDRTSVVAESRALRATYTTELAQDLKAVHGLDAESELANILSTEILAEINRELLNGINVAAKQGGYAAGGSFDLATQSDGRWSVEKYKGLILQIERDANMIAKDTRRGKGNFILVSSNVASALAAAGQLDYTPALKTDLEVDMTGSLFAGTLNGRIKVFVDPYTASEYVTVGYRGTNPYDAGVFYCPYVPLTMMRAIGENDFQPRIGFKTRYGIRANPFVDNKDGYGTGGFGTEDKFGGLGQNFYFRRFTVSNLIGEYEAS